MTWHEYCISSYAAGIDMCPNLRVNRMDGSMKAILSSKTGRAGSTLLEVMLALAILTAAFLSTLLLVMSQNRTNRETAMEVAATNIIRQQAEEVMAVSRNTAGLSATAAVVNYYGDPGRPAEFRSRVAFLLDSGIESSTPSIGNMNAIIYTFPIATPGERRDNNGMVVPDPKAAGRMIIYIDETRVPAVGGTTGGVIWEDMSRDSAEKRYEGLDLSRNGDIDNMNEGVRMNQYFGLADVQDSGLFNIKHLPIDISVTYFNDEDRTLQAYDIARRIVVTDP